MITNYSTHSQSDRMETVDLEMEDIFDGGVEEEDLAVPPPLPDLEDDAPGGSGLGADGGTLNTGVYIITSAFDGRIRLDVISHFRMFAYSMIVQL